MASRDRGQPRTRAASPSPAPLRRAVTTRSWEVTWVDCEPARRSGPAHARAASSAGALLHSCPNLARHLVAGAATPRPFRSPQHLSSPPYPRDAARDAALPARENRLERCRREAEIQSAIAAGSGMSRQPHAGLSRSPSPQTPGQPPTVRHPASSREGHAPALRSRCRAPAPPPRRLVPSEAAGDPRGCRAVERR